VKLEKKNVRFLSSVVALSRFCSARVWWWRSSRLVESLSFTANCVQAQWWPISWFWCLLSHYPWETQQCTFCLT